MTRILRVLTRPNIGGPMRQAVALWHAGKAIGQQTLLLVGRCAPEEASFDLDFDGFDIGEDTGAGNTRRAEDTDTGQQVARSLRAFCSNMAHELRTVQTKLGSDLRSVDHWNLLEQLGEIAAGFFLDQNRDREDLEIAVARHSVRHLNDRFFEGAPEALLLVGTPELEIDGLWHLAGDKLKRVGDGVAGTQRPGHHVEGGLRAGVGAWSPRRAIYGSPRLARVIAPVC